MPEDTLERSLATDTSEFETYTANFNQLRQDGLEGKGSNPIPEQQEKPVQLKEHFRRVRREVMEYFESKGIIPKAKTITLTPEQRAQAESWRRTLESAMRRPFDGPTPQTIDVGITYDYVQIPGLGNDWHVQFDQEEFIDNSDWEIAHRAIEALNNDAEAKLKRNNRGIGVKIWRTDYKHVWEAKSFADIAKTTKYEIWQNGDATYSYTGTRGYIFESGTIDSFSGKKDQPELKMYNEDLLTAKFDELMNHLRNAKANEPR